MAIKDITLVKKHLFLCNGGTCKINGAEEGIAALRNAINKAGLNDKIHTTKTLCNGRCKDGPIVIAMPEGIWFKQMSVDIAEAFVHDYLIHDNAPVENILFQYGSENIYPAEVVTVEHSK